MKKVFIIGLLFSFLICNKTDAQIACPPNIDFETGTFSDWQLYIGTCCAISTPTLSGPVTGRHTLTNGSALDPYGGFPVVAPGGGNYSVMLGNSQTGAQAERARYYVHVPTGSGRYILVYRYAVVFQNPNHAAAAQPRFQVTAYDSATNVALPCAQYTYVSTAGIPGFSQATGAPNVWYKPWTTATLDLTGMGGQTVAIDFASGDCSAGGHFGYGYIDMNCGLFQVYAVNCNNSPNITLKAPPGYAHYRWMDSSLTTLIDTLQNVILPAPGTPRTYAVILTPYQGFGCMDTLYTQFVVANISSNAGADTSTCLGGSVQLYGYGTTLDTPMSYSWTPFTGLSCFNCQNPFAKPNGTILYKFTATSRAGCTYTDTVRVRIDSNICYANVSVNKDTVCPFETVEVKNIFSKPPTFTSYNWTNDSATITVSAPDSMTMYWTTPGRKKIKASLPTNTCSADDSVYVYVRTGVPVITARDVYICPGDTAYLNVTSGTSMPLTYHWDPPYYLTCIPCKDTKSFTRVSTKYTVTASSEYVCSNKAEVYVHIDTVANILDKAADTVCLNTNVSIKNKAFSSGTLRYIWSLDSGKIVSDDLKGSIVVNWAKPGWKKVKLIIDGNACDGIDSTYIFVKPPLNPYFKIPDLGCKNTLVNVEPIEQDAYYHWNIQEQTVNDFAYKVLKLKWVKSGVKTMSLTLKDDYHCDSPTYATTLDVHENPRVDLQLISEKKICDGDVITLNVYQSADYTYKWEPKEAFDNISGASAVMTLKGSGFITVSTTDIYGCTNSDTRFINTEICCKVFMPDAFTPNKDGVNDKYRPVGIERQTIQTFIITNRWGQIIYNSTSTTDGWDGTINGTEQDAGTYFYYLKYDCFAKDSPIEQKGSFILLR